MDLNLEQAFDGPVDLFHRFDVRPDTLGRPELLALEPVVFTGRLSKVEAGFVLEGTISLSGTVACCRCLAPVEFSSEAAPSWLFSPAHRRPAGIEEPDVELGAADLDVVTYKELSFPFDPFIDEQLQLEIPMKPICREGCKGICPECGADRNEVACSCAPPVDGRWKALTSLLPEGS
jgi:uncharacterized protein